MNTSLTAALLNIGLASASSQVTRTTDVQKITDLPFPLATASSDSHWDISYGENVPSTYISTGTPISLQDYQIAGTTIATDPTPNLAHGLNNAITSSTLSSSQTGYMDKTIELPEIPTSYPPPTALPSPIALTSYTAVAQPTLPTVLSSPIALTSYTIVAPPTLPISHVQATSILEPLIVHTERTAESLAIPSSRTYATPAYVTTHPIVPSHGVDSGDVSSHVPSETVTAPSTIETTPPEVVTTAGDYESTVTIEGSGRPVVTTISDQIMTVSDGEIVTVPATVYTSPALPTSQHSSTATQTLGSNVPDETDASESVEEGAAFQAGIESWSYCLLGLVAGAVALI